MLNDLIAAFIHLRSTPKQPMYGKWPSGYNSGWKIQEEIQYELQGLTQKIMLNKSITCIV